MYDLYDRGIDIVFLSDFSIKVLDCSDSVVFPFAHMIHKHAKHAKHQQNRCSFTLIFVYVSLMFIYIHICSY